MSIMRCDEHQLNWDSDKREACPQCDEPSTAPLDLDRLIQVCETLRKAKEQNEMYSSFVSQNDVSAALATFREVFNLPTILSLLRRLQAAEKRVMELEIMIGSGSDGK